MSVDPIWYVVMELAVIIVLLVIRCEQHHRDILKKR